MTSPLNIDFRVASPTDKLKAIEAQVKSLGGAIAGIGDPKQLLAFGQALEDQTEALHKFRLGSEDVVDQLKIFGDVGADTVAAIERISDPTRRMALAHELLSRKTNVTSKLTQRWADDVNALRAKLILASGGIDKYEKSVESLRGGFALATGGALALAGAVGGALTGAVSKFIEEDKKAAKAVKGLTDQMDELLFTLGNAVVGGDNFSSTADKMTSALEGLTKTVDENREEIFAFSKEAVVGLTHVVEWTAKAVLGLYGVFQGAVDGLQELFRQGFLGFLNLAEGLADALGIKLGQDHYDLKLTVETDTSAFKETERLASLLEGITSGADKVRAFFGEGGAGSVSAPVSSAKDRARTPSGGRKDISSLIAQASGKVGGGIALGGQRADERFNFTQQQETDFLVGDLRAAFDPLASVVAAEQGPAAAQRRGEASDAMAADVVGPAQRAAEAWKVATGVFNDAKGAAQGLAGSLADVAAAIGSGELKASQFGSALKSAFGQQLVELGKGYVLQGAAMVLSGDPVGIPLAAAGGALALYGGTLSKKGAGGGAPSVGSAGAVSGAARAAGQGARAEQRQTTAVLRIGEKEMQATVSDMAGDGQRRGQTSQRGRR